MADHEQFMLDGELVGTGLMMPNAQEQLLMANVESYPDDLLLDPKDIQRALVINGADRYKADRERRQKWMRNQGGLGKCDASSNTSAITNLCDNQGMPITPLSDCFVYANGNGGKDQGMALITTFKTMQEIGASPMELHVGGLTKTLRNDFYNKSQVEAGLWHQATIEAKRFRGLKYYKAPTESFSKYNHALASAAARKHQIVFAWHVGSNSMRLQGDFAVVGRGAGNHSNLIHSAKWVGGATMVVYDDENSWGPCVDPMYGKVSAQGWGIKGFAFFHPEDVFACAHNHCTYICVGVQADPNDPAFHIAA